MAVFCVFACMFVGEGGRMVKNGGVCMNNEDSLLIPGFQRVCHSIIRTPMIGPSWLILGLMVITGGASFPVRFILALAVLLATWFTAWPTVVLTPFAMIASLFFLNKLDGGFAVFYTIYLVTGAVVYSTYLLVTFRLMTERYVINPVTRQIWHNPSSFIRGGQ